MRVALHTRVRELTASLGTGEREEVFTGTAIHVYGL